MPPPPKNLKNTSFLPCFGRISDEMSGFFNVFAYVSNPFVAGFLAGYAPNSAVVIRKNLIFLKSIGKGLKDFILIMRIYFV
jgi:hypothetical protein